MSFATKVTIGTGNKITQSYQSQDVSISISYDLERTDTDLIAFMAEKAIEVEACHTAVWQGIFAKRSERGIMAGIAQEEGQADSAEHTQPKRTRKASRSVELEPAASSQSATASTTADTQQDSSSVQLASATEPQQPANESALASPELTGTSQQSADERLYEPATNVQKIAIRHLSSRKGYTPDSLKNVLRDIYGKESLDDLTKPEGVELLALIQKGELDLQEAA